jgi:hypothetical protein
MAGEYGSFASYHLIYSMYGNNNWRPASVSCAGMLVQPVLVCAASMLAVAAGLLLGHSKWLLSCT